ncbi:MAG TPA: amidohydrolase family protein, partial [Chryseolinea sp.]|nr:amidohydrolase family protein [Chryseolinea sp.]
YQPNPEYNGKTLAEVSLQQKLTASKMLIELIRRLDDCDEKFGECDGSIVATSMKEEDVVALMRWEFTNICSDGASAGRHPRGFGAFARMLAHYVRESEALTLQQAIHKMTALSAQNLGLTQRGVIKPGYFADLVLFDPEQVADNATIKKPQALSSGIVRVWVNGTEVYNASGTTKKYPGKVLRRVSL